MGVTGLLKLLHPYTQKKSLDEFNGQILAVDGYAWLHRAAACCAKELIENTPTAKLVQSIDRRVRLYELAGVRLYFVFDGDDLPLKSRIDAQRKEAREKAKQRHQALKTDETDSKNHALRGVNILPEHAAMVIEYLRTRGIPFVVAPYEADAQLVYLENRGIVNGILSEDSDLLVFGAQTLVTKSDSQNGECMVISRNNLPPHFQSLELMRCLAIISGCDYSPGINGMGPVKTLDLVKRFNCCLQSLLTNLERSGRIDEEFTILAKKADLAFQYQRVWDPQSSSIKFLNECEPEELDLLKPDIVGKSIDSHEAQRVCRGVVDPLNRNRALTVPQQVTEFLKTQGPFTARKRGVLNALSTNTIINKRLRIDSNQKFEQSRFFAAANKAQSMPATASSLSTKPQHSQGHKRAVTSTKQLMDEKENFPFMKTKKTLASFGFQPPKKVEIVNEEQISAKKTDTLNDKSPIMEKPEVGSATDSNLPTPATSESDAKEIQNRIRSIDFNKFIFTQVKPMSP